MTLFYSLKTMPDNEIQNWLRKVGRENAETLAKALTVAGADVQECVFRNMSTRAKSFLKEDIRKYSETGVNEAEIKEISLRMEKLM